MAKASALNSEPLGNTFISEKLGLAYFLHYRPPPGEIVERAENPRKPAALQAPLKNAAIVAVRDR